MFDFSVNYVAVVGAAVVNMIIGMIWYSPAAFGKQWMHASGLREADIKKAHMGRAYGLATLVSVVTAFVLALFVSAVAAVTPIEGVAVGALAWLGFVVTTSANDVIWGKKSLELYWLNNAYHLVSFVLMTVVLAVWA